MNVIKQPRRRAKPHIDMTPLIDCVFTLLIVLMLAATFNTPDTMDLTLPAAATIDAEKQTPVVVSVLADGKIYIGNNEVELGRLSAELKKQLAETSLPAVTVRGDEKTPYESIVKTLDEIRKAGITNVNLVHR